MLRHGWTGRCWRAARWTTREAARRRQCAWRLGTNARAADQDILPDPDSNEQLAAGGSDLDAELIWDGWPIRSKLWLLRWRQRSIRPRRATAPRRCFDQGQHPRCHPAFSSITKSARRFAIWIDARGHPAHRRAGDNLSRAAAADRAAVCRLLGLHRTVSPCPGRRPVFVTSGRLVRDAVNASCPARMPACRAARCA